MRTGQRSKKTLLSFLGCVLLVIAGHSAFSWLQSVLQQPTVQFRKLTAEEVEQSTRCVQRLHSADEEKSLVGQSADMFQDCFAKSTRIDKDHLKTVYYLRFDGPIPSTLEGGGAMVVTVDNKSRKLTCVTIIGAEY